MKKKRVSTLRNEPVPRKSLPRKYCGFCKSGIDYMNYKDPEFLRTFLNTQGKILRAGYTGNCRKHQKKVGSAIKKARKLAFLPYVTDNFK